MSVSEGIQSGFWKGKGVTGLNISINFEGLRFYKETQQGFEEIAGEWGKGLGFGMGVLNLSYDDFCRLTPEEFRETCRAWKEVEESREKHEWERMRTHAVMVMQPHCRKKLTPANILPFPWDGDGRKKKEDPQISKDEQRHRLERLVSSRATP